MTEDRAREAVEHLQRAALEMIEAGRAFLDLAEDLVKDPAPLMAAAAVAADAASSFTRRAAPSNPAHADPNHASGRHDTGDGPAPATRIQHIRVS